MVSGTPPHSNVNLTISKNNKEHVIVSCNQVEEMYHFYDAHHVILYAVWILALVLIFPTTIANLFAIQVFMKRKSVSNFLLLHTALCDAMFGFVALPKWSAHLGLIIITRSYNCTLMLLTSFFGLSLAWISFATTFLISVDKHLAIFYPYFYEEKIKERRRVFMIPLALFWLLMVLLQLTCWFITEVPLLQSAPLVIPIFCIYSIYIHIRIYILVKRTRTTIRSMEVAQQSSSKSRRSHGNTKDVQAARLTALILASLCICYLPYFTLQTAVWIHSHMTNSVSPTMYTAYPVVLLFAAMKCLINPLLYYCQKQAMRDSFHECWVNHPRSFNL